MARARTRGRRRERKFVPQGKGYIRATFNNTLVTFTDLEGNVVAWGSAGTVGFKGARKGTAFAAQRAAETAARKAMEQGLKEVQIYIRGPGSGREAAIRTLQSVGLIVSGIHDVTPVPHNGCRPRKRRRT